MNWNSTPSGHAALMRSAPCTISCPVSGPRGWGWVEAGEALSTPLVLVAPVAPVDGDAVIGAVYLALSEVVDWSKKRIPMEIQARGEET